MIIFKKNGIFYDNDINPEHEEYVYKEIESIIPYLAEPIEFDENLTLRDFFHLLEPDEKMIELVFGSHLGHFPIRPYMDEVSGDCVPDGKEEMEYIECSWVTEQFDYALFYKNHKDDKDDEGSVINQLDMELHVPKEDDKNDVSIYIDVHGWGPNTPGEDEVFPEDYEPPTHTSYGIEFTPLNRMAHLPLRLNKSIEIRDRNEMGNEDPIVEGVMYFNTFDVVGAILSEISFCGAPKDRDEQWQGIVDDVDEAKRSMKDDDDNDTDNDDDDEDAE